MDNDTTTDSGWDNELPMSDGDNTFSHITLLGGHEHGFCDLYRGRRHGKWHVLKTLKPQYRDTPACLAMMRKEFDIGFHLSHPGIAMTVGLEQVEGLGQCIIEEWVDGITLSQFMNSGSFTAAQAKDIAKQLCEVLKYIHTRQIIHRDLKPSNILITADGDRVKLIDFGVSDTASHAIFKGPAGTRKYAAPEIVNGNRTADSRSDLYSLGVILDQMNSKLPQPDRQIEKAAKWCMAEDPAQRPTSVSEVMTILNTKPSRKLYYIVAAVALAAIIALVISLIHHTPAQQQEINSDTTIVATTSDTAVVPTVNDTMVAPTSEQTADSGPTQPAQPVQPTQSAEQSQPTRPAQQEETPTLSPALRQLFLSKAIRAGMLGVKNMEKSLIEAHEQGEKANFNRLITETLKKRIETTLRAEAINMFSKDLAHSDALRDFHRTKEGHMLMEAARKLAFEYAQQGLQELFPDENIPPFPNDKNNWFE